jgi:hypothetical protein
MVVHATRLRFSNLLQFCLALAAAGLASGVSAQNASSVYSRVHNSVGIVLVSTFEGQLVASGSAVTVAPQTMVTNKHVLMPGYRYQVYLNGSTYEAYMTTCDKTQDLCLLDVRKLDAQPVEFADPSQFAVGDPVYAIGAPNEIGNVFGVSAATKQKRVSAPQLTLSNGLITALRPVDDGNVIQTNAAISPGSSGGGLFDANGRLVGITSFYMTKGTDLNMALPVNWVARLGVSGAPPGSTNTTPSSADYVSAPSYVAPSSSTPTQGTDDATPAPQPASSVALATPSVSESTDHTTLYYALGGAGVVVLGLFAMRHRSLEEEIVERPVSMRTPAPTDPLLQRFIAEATQELDQNKADPTLWDTVVVEHAGDKSMARRTYIKRRAARLLSQEKDRQWAEAARRSQTS